MSNKNSVRNLKKKAKKLIKNNKLTEARDIYIPLCQSVPNDLNSWVELAMIFRTLNDLNNAEKCCNHVISKETEHTHALHTYASILHIKGNRPAAINLYLKCIAANNTPTETYYFIANAYREIGDYKNSQLYYEKHLELDPSHFETLNNLSALYTEKGMISHTLPLLKKADTIQPNHSFVKNNLAKAYLIHGDTEKSSSITKAILDTGTYEAYIASNYLLSLNYLDLTPDFIFNEHKHWGTEISKNTDKNKFHFDKSAHAQLKIGFVSPDLIDHPVSRFIHAFFKHHDKNKLSIYCYSDTNAEDHVSATLKHYVDHWANTSQLSNSELANKIYKDEIDILIDLTGHTGNNRMPLYTLKPAPLQVTYLGYPNTTGIQEFDYRITDAIADPVGTSDKLHTEQLIRLPNCFLAFTPEDSELGAKRTKKIDSKNIIFGSFNNLAKTTPDVIATWANILHSVPGSKLMLKSAATSDLGIQARYINLFKQNNIKEERIILLNTATNKKQHYECYNKIDIALDTFPYNGTTTTFEALWMNVPVLTLSGKTHVSRVSHSILHHLSLDSLVARTVDEYVEKATELAADTSRLEKLHSTLRENMQASNLFNYEDHTKDIEKSLLKMWSNYNSKN